MYYYYYHYYYYYYYYYYSSIFARFARATGPITAFALTEYSVPGKAPHISISARNAW